jgi:hypothetical protein
VHGGESREQVRAEHKPFGQRGPSSVKDLLKGVPMSLHANPRQAPRWILLGPRVGDDVATHGVERDLLADLASKPLAFPCVA